MINSLIRRVLFAGLAIVVLACSASARTYTLNADFDEGILKAVQHDTVPDQLQLDPTVTFTLPFIWVPSYDGTVSKLDTVTGKELGRYRVAPPQLPFGGNPSRTTVDLEGSCWVGCRQAGTVVKIGLLENGGWIDRNGDGIPQTSTDLDNDGYITGAEILPWGQDECVLWEVVLVPGHEGAYVPGTYPGPYDSRFFGPSPRGLAVDARNNLWAGAFGTGKYYYIDSVTGQILKTVDVSSYGHSPYGAVIDRNGILWSAVGDFADNILAMDTRTDPVAIALVPLPHRAYSVGLDFAGHLFVTGWCDNAYSRIDTLTRAIDWTCVVGLDCSRGVVCTRDNDIWVANSNNDTVTRYANDGTCTLKATIPVGSQPSGIAVDAAGKVWVCDKNDEFVSRIDPATNAVDLTKQIIGSGGHYSYSDMTGIIVRNITTKIGTWTVIHDGGPCPPGWGTITWNNEPQGSEPPGTQITVRVRSSDDQANWSEWFNAANGGSLMAVPCGRYLQIEVTLQIISGDVSPVLSDLTVTRQAVPLPDSFQAYPGNSKGLSRYQMGHMGLGADTITAVPGILSIWPGPRWANYVRAAPLGIDYTIKNVVLIKETPVFAQCADIFPAKTVKQQGSANVRLWWPLMYEAPGTKWTLTILYGTSTAWDDDGPGPNPPAYVHTDKWEFQTTATLESMKNLLALFHEVPFGKGQIPLISDEVLYPILVAKLDAIIAAVAAGDLVTAAAILGDFEMEVMDACTVTIPPYPRPTGSGTGIANSYENPACCKLMADAEYVGKALGLFELR